MKKELVSLVGLQLNLFYVDLFEYLHGFTLFRLVSVENLKNLPIKQQAG